VTSPRDLSRLGSGLGHLSLEPQSSLEEDEHKKGSLTFRNMIKYNNKHLFHTVSIMESPIIPASIPENMTVQQLFCHPHESENFCIMKVTHEKKRVS
jgi:hypothetical protein